MSVCRIDIGANFNPYFGSIRKGNKQPFMQHVTKPNRPVAFLLGIQRSGTTWLANVLDASEEILLFMEPFAPSYGLFPEFPPTSFYLEHSNAVLDRLMKVEMPMRLLRNKALISQRSLTDKRWFRLELSLLRLAEPARRFLPMSIDSRLRRFQLLNLNRTESSFTVPQKYAESSIWVIKELRLAGKIPILRKAYPEAPIVVITRHPVATVHSILSWFERGGLGELHKDLDTYLECLEVQSVAGPYQSLIERCRCGSLAHKIALYWRVNYEVMYSQLQNDPFADFLIYERMATQPRETAVELITRLGGVWSASLERYLQYSSGTESKKPTAINTVRDSTTHYRAWVDKIDSATRAAVEEIVGDSLLMKNFAPFYE